MASAFMFLSLVEEER